MKIPKMFYATYRQVPEEGDFYALLEKVRYKPVDRWHEAGVCASGIVYDPDGGNTESGTGVDVISFEANRYATAVFRMDIIRPNTTWVRDQVRIRCEVFCKENGLARCPKSVRTQIRENVMDEALARTLPTVKTCAVVLGLDTREVWFERPPEAYEALLRRALSDLGCVDSTVLPFGGAVPKLDADPVDFFGAFQLAFLESLQNGVMVGDDADIRAGLGEKITLQRGEQKIKAQALSEEVLATCMSEVGQRITEIGIAWEYADYMVTAQVTYPGFDLLNARVDIGNNDGPEPAEMTIWALQLLAGRIREFRTWCAENLPLELLS